MAKPKKLNVFFDGACPLCKREISFYRRRQGADHVTWVDVSGSSHGEVAPGLWKDEALARFHVMHPDGTLVSGGRAFAELWAALPGFRTWGRLFRYLPFTWILNRAYILFLGFRPYLQTMMAARQFPSPAVVRGRASRASGTSGTLQNLDAERGVGACDAGNPLPRRP